MWRAAAVAVTKNAVAYAVTGAANASGVSSASGMPCTPRCGSPKALNDTSTAPARAVTSLRRG